MIFKIAFQYNDYSANFLMWLMYTVCQTNEQSVIIATLNWFNAFVRVCHKWKLFDFCLFARVPLNARIYLFTSGLCFCFENYKNIFFSAIGKNDSIEKSSGKNGNYFLIHALTWNIFKVIFESLCFAISNEVEVRIDDYIWKKFNYFLIFSNGPHLAGHGICTIAIGKIHFNRRK